MTIKWQKQVVTKQATKIHTEARHLALKLDLKSTNNERKYNKEFVNNLIFLKINKRGDPHEVQGVAKQLKN